MVLGRDVEQESVFTTEDFSGQAVEVTGGYRWMVAVLLRAAAGVMDKFGAKSRQLNGCL